MQVIIFLSSFNSSINKVFFNSFSYILVLTYSEKKIVTTHQTCILYVLLLAVSRPSQIYEDLSSDEEENETESIPRRSPRKHKDSRPKDSSPTQRNSSPTQRRRMTALPPLESDDSERPIDRRSPAPQLLLAIQCQQF